MTFFSSKKKIADSVIAFALVLLIGPVQAGAAELINIQFQSKSEWNQYDPPYSGAAVIGGAGDTWNQLTAASGTSSSLVNSAGVQTNTSISWTGDGLFSSGNGFSKQPESALMTSYLYSHGLQTITFSKLQENSTYNIYIYTQGAGDGKGRILTVGGTQINGGTETSKPMDPWATTFISGQNYLTLTGATNSTGVLSITYSAIGTSGGRETGFSEADINGIQLMQASGSVPEPSTYVLMGIGGLLCAFKLKRFSKSEC